MLTPGHTYEVRSGVVSAWVGDTATTLPTGTQFVFSGMNENPPAEFVHPHELKKYGVYTGTVTDGRCVHVALAVSRVYPDPDKRPDFWYDNAPLMMFNKVTKGPARVLFLDIDGVLNTDDFLMSQHHQTKDLGLGRMAHAVTQFQPDLMARFHGLVKSIPDLKVVVSSSWRLSFTQDELSLLLGVPVYDLAPKVVPGQKFTQQCPRGAYIEAWLNSRAWDVPIAYAIVDDDITAADGFENVHGSNGDRRGVMAPRFVLTHPNTGLTDTQVEFIKDLLV